MKDLTKQKLELAATRREMKNEASRLRAIRTLSELRSLPNSPDEGDFKDLIKRMSTLLVEAGSSKYLVKKYGLTYREGAVLMFLRTSLKLEDPTPSQMSANKQLLEYLFGSGMKGEEDRQKASASANQVGIVIGALPEKKDLKQIPFLSGEGAYAGSNGTGSEAFTAGRLSDGSVSPDGEGETTN